MSPKPPRPEHTYSSSDPFGKGDDEISDNLVNPEVPAQKQAAIPKEPSSSSELFGTEDSAFLDELSKIVLPDDIEQTPRPDQPIINAGRRHDSRDRERSHSPDHEIYNSHIGSVSPPTDRNSTDGPTCINPEMRRSPNWRVRKRSRSPEQANSASQTGTLSPTNEVLKDGSTYIDSDIYGPSKFHGFGEYMRRKRAKLSIQNADMEVSSGGKKSALFKGLALYINGKTATSVQELRKLIIQNGGIFHPYLDRKKMVTHIIASNLTPAKVLEFKHMKVVTPSWLLESIKAGLLLPWRDYIIGADGRPDASQGKPVKSLGGANGHSLDKMKQSNVARRDATQAATDTVLEQETIPQMDNLSTAKAPSDDAPLCTTDPSTTERAVKLPPYALSGSNPLARRKIEDPEWRAANTAVASGFIEGYYKNSRLHHLSTWKTELQDLVAKAAAIHAEKGKGPEDLVDDFDLGGTSARGIKFQKPTSSGKGKGKITDSQVIMHCDFDSFFVSAGIVDRPHLKGKPVAVCHSQGKQGGALSTSEIASCSYEARKYGVKNGMSLGQVKKLCPEIQTIPYEFERYKSISLQFYTILLLYADDLQAVSVDEALIDVSSIIAHARSSASAESTSIPENSLETDLAETIRAKVRHVTGCEVSIGISHNILLARIATRRAKPAGICHIRPEDVSDVLTPLDIKDLWGFGWSTRKKVEAKFGVTILGELQKYPRGSICDALGKKTGETLWKAIRGIDNTRIESDRVRKSVSSEINYGIRFNDEEEAGIFILRMAQEVSKRLTSIQMCGRSLTLKVMTRDPAAPVEAPKFLGHGICDTTNKTSTLTGPGGKGTADADIIGECAWRLLKSMNLDAKELRGIGIHVQKLNTTAGGAAPGLQVGGGQPVLPFGKMENETLESAGSSEGLVHPAESPSRFHDADVTPIARRMELPSLSQVDPSFLDALPSDVREEVEQEYARLYEGQTIAGPSHRKSPDINQETSMLAPKSRPPIGLSKRMHPLFSKRKSAANLKVSATELKLLDIDLEVWAGLPVELQREQLAALRAANVGTGMAIRASMTSQAKQEGILSRWRTSREQRSPSVGIRGRRPKITANALELPLLKQRGKSKGEELKVRDTNDIQTVIRRWVRGFENDGPRTGDIEYFGKFLERCTETDAGTEKALSALKWWRLLLLQRWPDTEKGSEDIDMDIDAKMRKVGQDWWNAFWGVKSRMDHAIRKRFGGKLSLK